MDAFLAIAEPTRRSIVETLAQRGTLSASEIGLQFNISAPAVSQHLKVLREARVVTVQKDGQRRMYELDMETMYEIGRWAHTITQVWNKRFDKLEKLLQAEKITTNKKHGK